MRFCLINPNWNFASSIYFGCREPHLPLEYGYSKRLLEDQGHEVEIIDAQSDRLALAEIRNRAADFRPHFTIVTTAPSYLFWRCAPPELREPQEVADAVRDIAEILVVVGPHSSTTPRATLRKLNADVAVIGECEEVLPKLDRNWPDVDSICYRDLDSIRINGAPHVANMSALPALRWPVDAIRKHSHHHHRFDAQPLGPGAEMETSRGCPFHCTFCAKDNFRDDFRRRPVDVVAEELDALVATGIEYVYFIDEIFLPYRELLDMVRDRRIKFGIQTRIDLWSDEMIHLLADAGCVSIEAGVESITEAGRARLDKKCKVSTEEISRRLILAKEALRIPFVQANLLDSKEDDPAEVERWREELRKHGVWANKPVPMFSYPGSPDYTNRWGAADDEAWERAHESYLSQFDDFSDVQEQRPAPLVQLELKR